MRADCIHGNIGIKMKRCANVYDYDSFVGLCRGAAKKVQPICMQLNDFYQFQSGSRSRKKSHVASAIEYIIGHIQERIM